MWATLTNRLTLHSLPERFAAELRDKLTLANPEHADAERQGRYAEHLDPFIRDYFQRAEDLVIPPGAVGFARWLARQHSVLLELDPRGSAPFSA
jgi:hypothetical protein